MNFLKSRMLTAVTLTIIIGLTIYAFYQRRSSQLPAAPELVVGMMSGWAPFMSINGAGEFEGFDVDVAAEMAKRMGKKLVIKDIGSLASLFLMLEQGSIDMVISGLDITQKRREAMNMVPYYGQDQKEYCLMFWDKIPDGITTIDDLKNYSNPTVCVEPGVSMERFLDRYTFIIKKPMAVLAERVLDIQYGKSLAVFIEPTLAARLAKQQPRIKMLMVPLPPEFQIYGCGIALRKSDSAMTSQVTTVIQALKQEGIMAKLEKKWGLS